MENGKKILTRIHYALVENEGSIFYYHLLGDGGKTFKRGSKTLYEILLESASSSDLSIGLGLKYIIVPTDESFNTLMREYFKEEGAWYHDQDMVGELILGHVISSTMTERFPTRELYYGANGYKYIGEKLKNSDDEDAIHQPEVGDIIEGIEIVKVIDVPVKDLAKPKTMAGITTRREKIRLLFIEGFLIPQKYSQEKLDRLFK